MWTIIILFIGAFVYFNIFYKETKSKNSGQKRRPTQTRRRNSEAKIPGVDWIFKKEIDQPGVPTVINNYRKVLNGYDYKKIVRSLKGIVQIKNEVQRNLAYLQFVEPLAELERNGNFEMNEDMPHLFFDHFFLELFNFLNAYYPAIGAQGQMRNLEDICKYIPEVNGFEQSLAYGEIQLREDILQIIKKNGFIYNKDLNKDERFTNYSLGRNLIYRLIEYNIIEEGKEGRYVIYKIKN